MNTEEAVDELIERYPGWQRDGQHGVLRFLDQAQKLLLAQESMQNVVFDEVNGRLPPLATIATQLAYNLPDTVWRLGAILVEQTTSTALATYRFYSDYGWRSRSNRGWRSRSNRKPEYLEIGGIAYLKIPYVRSWDWQSDTQPARLMFTRDPGTETDIYRYYAYRRPTPLLSEAIALSIPSPWDESILITAAGKLVEGVQNGNKEEALRTVNLELKPALWNQMNSGEQSRDIEPEDHGF